MSSNDINNLSKEIRDLMCYSVYLLTQYLWLIADICLRTILVPLLSLFVLFDSQPYESVLESINKRVSFILNVHVSSFLFIQLLE